MEPKRKRLVFAVTPVFWSVLLLFLGGYVWKISGIFWIPGVSDHFSNFALTGMFSLLLIGPRSFEEKKGRTRVLLVSSFFVVANLVVEVVSVGTFQGFNVLDMYDALYGLAASLIVFLLHLYVVKRKQLM